MYCLHLVIIILTNNQLLVIFKFRVKCNLEQKVNVVHMTGAYFKETQERYHISLS